MLLASVACGDEVSNLRAENASLKHENAQLKKIVADMTTKLPDPENESQDPKEPTANTDPKPVRYKGKARSEAWVDAQYCKFFDKIALVDGKFYDIGKSKLEANVIDKRPPKIGQAVMVIQPGRKPAKIIEVLPDGVVIAERPEEYDVDGKLIQSRIQFRVHGMKAPKVGDTVGSWSAVIKCWLIYIGSKNRIQEYHAFKPLTKTEFREALEKGFRLVEWKKEQKLIVVHGTHQGAKSSRYDYEPVYTKTVVK